MLIEILLGIYVATYVAKNKCELGIPKAIEIGKKAAAMIKDELEKRKNASIEEKKRFLNEAIEKVLNAAPAEEIQRITKLFEKYAFSDEQEVKQ